MEEIAFGDYYGTFGYFCLICCNAIDPQEQRKGLKPVNVQEGMFATLSNYMTWNETGRQFQFEFELFPFCDNCIPTVESMYKLNEQVQNLLRRIDQLCAKSMNILLSRNKCEQILKARNSRNLLPETSRFDADKVCSFRDVILRRFTTSVKISPSDQVISGEHYKNMKMSAIKQAVYEPSERSELSTLWSNFDDEDMVDLLLDPDFYSADVVDEIDIESDLDLQLEDETTQPKLKFLEEEKVKKLETRAGPEKAQRTILETRNAGLNFVNGSEGRGVSKVVTLKAEEISREVTIPHGANLDTVTFCGRCNRNFKHRKSKWRHVDIFHKGATYPCTVCQKDFNRKDTHKAPPTSP